jgi:hypothetical protein
VEDGYLLHFYTWYEIGGKVTRWTMKVARDGTITIIKKKWRRRWATPQLYGNTEGVGQCFGLA